MFGNEQNINIDYCFLNAIFLQV